MSPTVNQNDNPDKGAENGPNGLPKLTQETTDDDTSSKNKNTQGSPNRKNDEEMISLIDMVYRRSLTGKHSKPKDIEGTELDHCFAFQLSNTVQLDDEGELEVDTAYLDALKHSDYYVSMSFELPLEKHRPKPKNRGLSKTSLYFKLLFLIYRHELPNSSLDTVITRALDTLVIIKDILPQDINTFLELQDWETEMVKTMKHLTKRVRSYIILMRKIGKYILDDDKGHERTLIEAYWKFKNLLQTVHDEMKKQDEIKVTPTPVTTQNTTQQVIAAPKYDHFLSQPFPSFKATANDTWSAIIRKIAETCLKNPITNKLGQALAVPDYDQARKQIPQIESQLSPQHSDAFQSNIKMTICDSLCSFKPQANRSELISLPLIDFIIKWKEFYSGDRDVNQRMRDNLHVLSGIHLVNDGVMKSLTKAA